MQNQGSTIKSINEDDNMNEYWCAECDEWNVNCSCKASKIIKELEEKLAAAELSRERFIKHIETVCCDNANMVNDLAKKLDVAREALERIEEYQCDESHDVTAKVALEKIKR